MKIKLIHRSLNFLKDRFKKSYLSGENIQGYPLLANLFSIDQLEKHGEALARIHELDQRPGKDKLLARLTKNENILIDTYELLTAGEQAKLSLTPAGVWFLDNFYLIKEQIQIARKHLPKSYSQELPRLRSGPSAGLPRVYNIVKELITHVDGRVDEGNLSSIVNSYQRVTPLKLGELWAIPIMLRLAMIENLCHIAMRIDANRKDRNIANVWADRMLETAEKDPKNIILDMADMSRAKISMTSSFVAELVRRLQRQNPALVLPLTWIEQRLAEQGQTIELQIQLDSQHQATNQISISNSITSLRFLTMVNWKNFVENMSHVEHILRKDPAGIYHKMNFTTRDNYRHIIEKIAKQSRQSEEIVAVQAVKIAEQNAGQQNNTAHVGYYLIDKGRPLLEKSVNMKPLISDILKKIGKKAPLLYYLGSIFLVTSSLTFLFIFLIHSIENLNWLPFAFLFFLGFSQMSITLINWVSTILIPPRLLPRMDFSNGIPLESCTLITVPTMLSSKNNIGELMNKMEVFYLANKAENLYFSLLTDFMDASVEFMPDDRHLFEMTREGIKDLNDKYGHNGYKPFLYFHRSRQWNPEEKLWMGYERKRGKLEALNIALRSKETTELLIEGDSFVLPQIKYIITLDTDTQLPHDTARQLIETMSHPLNTPVYDHVKQRVVSGYTILQPRVVSSLSTTNMSPYSKIFGSDSGIDPYTRAVSDVYQDIFQEGSFIGKGIYDVDMFIKVLKDRLPENRILSHDLLEGTYCRAGLVSDVQLVDDFPERYSEDISRHHRWIRGDWQIAAWLLPCVPGFKQKYLKNPISLLSRWKIFDNLRRSIVPVGLLLLIVLSWILLKPCWLGLAVVAGIIFIPVLPGIFQQGFRIPTGFPLYLHIQSIMVLFGRQFFQSFFMLMVLPYEAFFNLDAIIRTCWRMLFSHRKLLEWITSGEAKRIACTNCWSYYRLMLVVPMFALALGILFFTQVNIYILNAWILIVLWFFSPVLTWWISRSVVQYKKSLTVKQIGFLRKISRKTWRFFETFVSIEDNELPIDNYQEEPKEALAHRTSPTNIGLMLLSNLGAYDLGYLSTGQLIEKTRKTFQTMKEMSRFRGHFYNWYDTKTLQPMPPQYISTVDSGNLSGYLLTLRSGLVELKDKNIFQRQSFSGLIDIIHVLKDMLIGLSEKKSLLVDRLNQLTEIVIDLEQYPAELSKTLKNFSLIISRVHVLKTLARKKANPELDWWFQAFEDQCVGHQEDLIFLAPWLVNLAKESKINTDLYNVLDNNHTLNEIAQLYKIIPSIDIEINKLDASLEKQNNLRDFYLELKYQVKQGSYRAQGWIKQLDEMAGQCQSMADIDYDFLYDSKRHLLSIGYNVSTHRKDESFYDLMASESRLCSFVGIAQNKLPLEHWFALGRLVTIWKGKVILLSWGGSMFEYLMPQLVMPGYDNTLLGQTCQAIVERQIVYGHKRGVPWGISESAENITDANLNYQYRSFGVPDLGFKRGLANDLVIAPYASVLALMVKPDDACTNLQKLSDYGFEGKYGFYEAIDYTSSRLSHEQSEALIKSFMTHHQGMSFISLVNFFTNDVMIKRFESDPLFQTTVLLLQERVPKVTPFHLQPSELFRTKTTLEGQEDLLRVFNTPLTPFPEVHLLSNGHYHVMVTNAGGGYSRWRDISVTRWNEDQTKDNYGTFIYVNDISSNSIWSAAYQPILNKSKNYEAIFLQSRAEFRRRDQGLDTYTEIAVSPEDDIEHRRISLSNFTVKTRTIELTSYAEVSLISPAAEALHPAFSNLFIQTHIDKNHQAIMCSRRPRSPGEKPPWMFHLLVVNEHEQFKVSYETDRLKFIGRSRTPNNPRVLEDEGPLSGTDGSVLDPIISIRCRFTLKPGDTVTVGFITGMAETYQEAMSLIEKYQDRRLADRVFDIALIHGKVVLKQLNATEADAQLYGRLASSILYASMYRRANHSILMKNKRGQSNLWAYSISGDIPIILLRISDQTKIELASKLIQAHTYWRLKGLQVDLVIWNEDRSGYRQVLNDLIIGLISAGAESSTFDRTGGIYLRYSEQISEEDRILIQTAARVIITDNGGTLSEQISHYIRNDINIPKLISVHEERPSVEVENFKQDNLLFFNGWGGFTQDGREYVIQIKHGNPTPMPWVNIVANNIFGTVITQNGGYTWFENAHEFRLTPWYNDPVSDTSGEAMYLRDESTGLFWSPMPLLTPSSSDYLNRQGFGYSVFEYSTSNIKSELWIFVDVDAPVKFWMLKVRNDSNTTRRLSATNFLEIVLGDIKTKTQMYVKTETDSETGALLAVNPYNTEFAGRIMFLEANETMRSITGDRTEFIGRNGTLSDPAAMHCVRLSGKVGGGLDPAAAIQVFFELEPGQEKEIVFIMGVGRDIDDTRNLILKYRGSLPCYQARDKVWEFWNHTLGEINVETPDTALNMITNGWLLYQTMSSRLWARSGFYQSGGAFGFRDQLQDVMALVHTKPDLIRDHLLLCASRQFREGDVQHWWHPPQGRGVRTRISDDYLWLPLATCYYVIRTGDTGILDESITFIEGRPLNPGEESYYDLPSISEVKASLYEHCKIAIKHALRFGQHGLPLMGSGDWNDGMNLVGIEGKGESVWLAFFLYHVLEKFVPIAKMHKDESFIIQCTEEAKRLKENIDKHAWDGEWYRRAYFDNGTTLGSKLNQDCQIDAVAQSWAVLSGAAPKKKAKQSMQSLERRLIHPEKGLIQLLDPPFDKSNIEPGYIKGYVPGVRENGGQYTHAAVWTVMAFTIMGDAEKANELLSMINPVNHGSTQDKIENYMVEPYVVAADIYSAESHVKRGGWTWYTGSASWFYRLIIESVFGLDLLADKLYINPCIPKDWENFIIHYRYRETVYHLAFHQKKTGKGIHVIVDGAEQTDNAIILKDDHIEHFVEINIGNNTTEYE